MTANGEKRAFFLATVLLACFLPATTPLSVTVELPHSAELGSDIELSCSHAFAQGEEPRGAIVKWWWTPLDKGTDDKALIYQRIGDKQSNLQSWPNLSPKDKTSDVLTLGNLQPSHSGVYECEVSGVVEEDRVNQTLIVYTQGSGPQLNVSRLADGADSDEEPDVLVTCAADMVAPKPDLVITVAGQPASDVEWDAASDNGFFNVTANVTLSSEQAHNVLLKCELFYEDATVAHPAYVDIEDFTIGEPPTTDEGATLLSNETVVDAPTDGAVGLPSSFGLLIVALISMYGIII